MKENFNLYSKYYDLLYKNKNYQQEVDYLVSCLKAHAPACQSLLEFGSGTGGHGIHLKNRGFEVYGLERSEEMVKQANLLGLPSAQGDITSTSLNREFDAVISLFHVISYLTSNQDLVNTFKNASVHLNPKGLFIFDVWYTPAVYNLKPETRIKRVKNEEIEVTRIAEPVIHPNRNVVDVNYSVFVKDLKNNTYTTLSEKHPMRHFSIPELEMVGDSTGFELIKAEEFGSGNVPSENTWGVNFIFKKNG